MCPNDTGEGKIESDDRGYETEVHSHRYTDIITLAAAWGHCQIIQNLFYNLYLQITLWLITIRNLQLPDIL